MNFINKDNELYSQRLFYSARAGAGGCLDQDQISILYIHIPLAAVLLSRHYTRGCGCLGINKYEPSSVHSLHFSHDQEGWCGNIEMNDKLNKTFFIDWLLHALQLCNAGGYFLELHLVTQHISHCFQSPVFTCRSKMATIEYSIHQMCHRS